MGKICRNCHDKGGDLISPCMCSGTMKWVHRSCLDTWRTVSPNKLSFSECDVCHFKYRVQKKTLGMWPRISFGLKITRDVIFVLAVAVAMILIVGSICLLIERTSEYDKDFDPEVRAIFQNIYFQLFCMGFLGLCFIIGILAILAVMFSGCFTCCKACCKEPSYTYSTYSYNPCCDPWWCMMFYWWNAVYAPPGTCVCYPCCCCAFPVEDCCYICDCNNCNCDCDCDCNGCGNCDCGNNDDCGAVLIVILIIIVVIIILIGFFVGIGMFAITLKRLISNHAKVYRKQLDARELQVVDLDKHPEYIQDESAVFNITESEQSGLVANGGVDEEEKRKKAEAADYNSYVAPSIPLEDIVAPMAPVPPPEATGTVPYPPDYSYPAAPYPPSNVSYNGSNDIDDGVDGYPSATFK